MWSDWGLTGVDRVQKDQDRCLVAGRHNAPLQSPCRSTIQLRGTVYPFNVTLTIVGTIVQRTRSQLLDLPT